MSQDDYIRTALRVPPELHRALHNAADESERSFNAEIIERLKSSFEPGPSADGAVAQELADSRAQTITAMAFLQASMCETVNAMYSVLSNAHQRERTFKDAQRLAASLLVSAKPEDYLLSKSEMLLANEALARFLESVESDIEAHRKKEARSGRSGSARR